MQSQTQQVIAQWVSAYNRHDAQAAAATYHSEATNYQAAWDKTTQGREAMHLVFTNLFRSFPDIRLEIENQRLEGEWVTLEWRFSGTMHGAFAGYPPTGRRFELRGCEIFRITDGKILIQRGYWDKQTLLQQLGLVSPVG